MLNSYSESEQIPSCISVQYLAPGLGLISAYLLRKFVTMTTCTMMKIRVAIASAITVPSVAYKVISLSTSSFS